MFRELGVMGRAAYPRMYAIDTMRWIVPEDLLILYCMNKLYSSFAERTTSDPSKKAAVRSSSYANSVCEA
jgi:hypothetical protein